jgi:staphyloferrin B biosynthesis citrate synthase
LRPPASQFRQRLLRGEPLLGTFIKTPTCHAIEILGDVGFDFVIVDAEHAPFDRHALDIAMLAAKAANIAALVRVVGADPEPILSALDCGAAGVVVPHVASPEVAAAAAAAARYRGGRRGFSNSPRAGGYGRLAIWDHVAAADATTTVLAMIEDPEAVDRIEAILAVEGLDGVFIGRADLSVALGISGPEAEPVRSATAIIAAAAKAARKPVSATTAGEADARWLRDLGVSVLVVSSDQGLLRQAALRTLADFDDLSE